MKSIIVAGSTGYLGSHIVAELSNDTSNFRAIARSEDKLLRQGLSSDQIIKAEVTDPLSLEGKLPQADVLISTVGITRQKDNLTYMEVDYQANMNLLNEAKKAGIEKFIYVSVIDGQSMKKLKIIEAKERFVEALKESGLDYLIVRPNGFFSDMRDFLDMARKGKVYLFGQGSYKLNPIHGADLARAILEAVDSNEKELIIGGPDILTQNEIAELALSAWNQPTKIIHLPDWIRKLILHIMRSLTSSKTYGPIEFFLTMMAQDNIAPRHGIHRLKTYFTQQVDDLKEGNA